MREGELGLGLGFKFGGGFGWLVSESGGLYVLLYGGVGWKQQVGLKAYDNCWHLICPVEDSTEPFLLWYLTHQIEMYVHESIFSAIRRHR